MTPKDKAKQIFKKHLTALAEECMDSEKILKYNAKQCALVSVNEILDCRPGYPYPFELGISMAGLFESINYPAQYWEEVKSEIEKL